MFEKFNYEYMKNNFYILFPNKLSQKLPRRYEEQFLARLVAEVDGHKVFVGNRYIYVNGVKTNSLMPFVEIIRNEDMRHKGVSLDTALHGMQQVSKIYKNKKVLFENPHSGLIITRDFNKNVLENQPRFYYEINSDKLQPVDKTKNAWINENIENVVFDIVYLSNLINKNVVVDVLLNEVEYCINELNYIEETVKNAKQHFELLKKTKSMVITPAFLFPFVFKKEVEEVLNDKMINFKIQALNEHLEKKINQNKNGKYILNNAELKMLILDLMNRKLFETYLAGKKAIDNNSDLERHFNEVKYKAQLILEANEIFTNQSIYKSYFDDNELEKN